MREITLFSLQPVLPGLREVLQTASLVCFSGLSGPSAAGRALPGLREVKNV